jgi:TonB-linked SusC/RagA family outer membrane protein
VYACGKLKSITNLINQLMSMKKPLHLTCLLVFASAGAFASTQMANSADVARSLTRTNAVAFTKTVGAASIQGTVLDNAGVPLIGVTVAVKGTTNGTQTDTQGKFSLQTKAGDVLVFSYIGYKTQEVSVGDATTLKVVLLSDEKSLQEVVVTAFGIKRSEKSLTYSAQQVSGDELTRAKSDNLVNSLSGKVPGLTITPSASGVGGSAKVILRGNKSFAGNNQPLYVIDGIPMTNNAGLNSTAGSGSATGQPNNPFGGSTSVDNGDGISNLNPDDIESISVLKGAAASALYGSQGANGVILITTKKGKAGKTQINYNSSYMLSNIAYKPEFQNNYGRTSASSNDSWGAKTSAAPQDNLDAYFRTGNNWTNSINLSGGTEIAQTYFSYANTHADGVQPTNELSRNNFNLRETAKFLNNKLTVDGNVNYISQRIKNTPALGLYFNPLTGLYLFPRGTDINPYKNQYELTNQTGYARQNWDVSEDIQQNPWWIANRNTNFLNRDRFLFNGSLKYDFTNWLSFQVRGNFDRSADSYEQDLYSGTQATLSKANGQFIYNNQTQEQKYGDALLTFKVPMSGPVKVDGILGGSITDSKVVGTNLGAGLGLSTPNLFIAQNTIVSGTNSNASTLPLNHNQLQSVYGNVNLSYKEWLFLNLTARNDWSSNLSYTPNGSYFYPSAGLSVLLTQVLKLPTFISYAKVRGNYAEVGNTVPQYVTNPVNYLDQTGSVVLSTVAPFGTLKPERTKTYEIGADARFFNDNLNFSFNYYKSNTRNQFVQVIPSVATGYSVGYVNAGNVENKGFEFLIGYNIINNGKFKWNSSVNASRNINKIIDVDSKDGINQFILTGNANTNYESILAKGGSYGDIYGYTVKRDAAGRILLNDDGTPQINNGFNKIGNPTPKFAAGWNNTFNYKSFSLSVLVDGKFGGQVLSETQAIMDQYGVSKVTGEARDNGGVNVNGVNATTGTPVSSVNAKTWYTSIGGRQGVSELYMYSATVVRLREASLGYTFPLNSKVVKDLKLSVVGRNILYFYKKAPFDPELSMSTGNGLGGIDIFNQPATRNIGLNLNVTF